MSPRAVRTVVTRPRSRANPVTLVRSRIRTPRFRAPRARAWVMSDGLALASFGSQTAPTRPELSISGHTGGRLGHGDDVRLHALGLGHVGGAEQLGHPVAGGGHPQRAALVPAGAQAGLRLQARVQLAALQHQPGQRRVRAQLPDDPGRVPGRAAGELALLEQDDVGPAQLGQVVGHAAAHDPAADDHDLARCGTSLLGIRRPSALAACAAAPVTLSPAADIWAHHIEVSLARPSGLRQTPSGLLKTRHVKSCQPGAVWRYECATSYLVC